MSFSFKNILLSTDFSALAKNAAAAAIAKCKRHNARLHILHVVENRLLIAPPEANIASYYVVPEMESTAKEMLEKLAREIRAKHKIDVIPHLEFGNPADAIRDKAIDQECDLIILGKHGTSGFRNFFIGSTAYSVIRTTTIPVLTIPGNKRVKDFKKILFPIRAAEGIMRRYDFIEPVIEKNNAELFILGLSLKSEIFNRSERQDEIIELGTSLGVNDTTFRSEFHVCSNYAKKVLEIARKQKTDLIVINATLDYKWSQFFIGPYAQQIINHSKIPVLSIRTPENNRLFQPVGVAEKKAVK